jgi:predicted nucleotide-binding protein (sugar kinase/HSP70/actin superfamily)
MIEVDKTINGVSHLINENFRGECILTIGVAMREILNDSCGVISIGPFGCMYSRMAESILKKEMTIEGKRRIQGWNNRVNFFKEIGKLPFLSIESDGNPFPQLTEANLESFVLQAKRIHKILMKNRGRKYSTIKHSIYDIALKQ